MIPSIPQPKFVIAAYRAYIALFFVFLAMPLVVVAVFAFNDSQFPSLPWEGFTWNWFFGSERPQIGVFHERSILKSIGTSVFVALIVSALNLGAGPLTAIRTITLPYLAPAMIGAFVIAFLMSFENFNTTLMLVGSDAPLTIAMFDRLKEGSTPLLNAVSLLLMFGSSCLALFLIFFQRKD